MASKQRADKQKEKEKKEKIILAALVGVLVIVGAFELPKVLKSGNASSAADTPAQTTSTSPGATSSATAASRPTTVGSLPNANTYHAGVGQLSEFSLFNGKDPFGNVVTTSSEPVTGPTTTAGETTSSTATTPTNSYAAANISVNGTSQAVPLKGTFPSASPAFVLESLTAKEIKISVNGGSFASGAEKVTIRKGKSVVLVNTVDSMRYVIKYVAPLTAEQALALISTTTPGGTTTDTTSNSTATTSAG